MSPDLPADLRHALDRLVEGRARGDIARRARAISDAYRAGGSSAGIATVDDALAYALVRLPATYAAAAAVLGALGEAQPDFLPQTLLDVGAGPGTAAFAAAEHYPSLREIGLIDRSRPLRDLARALVRDSDRDALREARYTLDDAIAATASQAPADLVLASYVLGELPSARLVGAADALWAASGSVLAVIEPGTPAGFGRIAAVRAHLIARGAQVLAPCPHAHPCPIVAPDWCHFVQRLARSRAHRQAKGGDLAYEDEKFAYVIVGRGKAARPFGARVLAPPQVGKAAVTAKLCTQAGSIEPATVPSRDRAAYKTAKSWRWGDAIDQAD